MATLDEIIAAQNAAGNRAVDEYLARFKDLEETTSKEEFVEFVNRNGRALTADIAGFFGDATHQSILANINPLESFPLTRAANFDAIARWQQGVIDNINAFRPIWEAQDQENEENEENE